MPGFRRARLGGKFWLGNFQVGTFLGARHGGPGLRLFLFLALLIDKPRGDTRLSGAGGSAGDIVGESAAAAR